MKKQRKTIKRRSIPDDVFVFRCILLTFIIIMIISAIGLTLFVKSISVDSQPTNPNDNDAQDAIPICMNGVIYYRFREKRYKWNDWSGSVIVAYNPDGTVKTCTVNEGKRVH